MRKLIASKIGIAVALTLITSMSWAVTLKCAVRANFGDYRVELFRTGDRYPTRTIRNVRIDGGKVVQFNDIGSGRYFVRATHESYPWITGQGADAYAPWFYLWKWLPDCNVRP